MTRLLSVVPVLLVVMATPPIHAGQTGGVARVPDEVPSPVAVRIPPALHSSSVIQGNALDSTDGPLSKATVRLRDARFGRIVETHYTDEAGLFEFTGIEPGTYIVELLGSNQSILAASQLINVNAGDSVVTLVKLPFKTPPFADLMGTTSKRSAAILLLNAAAAGVTALAPTAPISPNR
jgi:hypothetical protein